MAINRPFYPKMLEAKQLIIDAMGERKALLYLSITENRWDLQMGKELHLASII